MISVGGGADDTLYAPQSLNTQGARYRIPDIKDRQYQRRSAIGEANGRKEHNLLMGEAVVQ